MYGYWRNYLLEVQLCLKYKLGRSIDWWQSSSFVRLLHHHFLSCQFPEVPSNLKYLPALEYQCTVQQPWHSGGTPWSWGTYQIVWHLPQRLCQLDNALKQSISDIVKKKMWTMRIFVNVLTNDIFTTFWWIGSVNSCRKSSSNYRGQLTDEPFRRIKSKYANTMMALKA